MPEGGYGGLVRRFGEGAEERFLRHLGFHTAAFTFDAPEAHDRIGDRFCLTESTGRQIGFYRLCDGQVAVFTVHRTPDPTLPPDPRAALLRHYDGLGWITPQALDRCPAADHVYYDQVAQIDLPSWSRGHVTLVGDACQAVSLLAGQGASLPIAGAYLLAQRLDRDPTIETALDHYEQSWRPVVADRQRTARNAARWFVPHSAWQLHVRRAALRATSLPAINRYVGKALAGKPGTLPL
ncbi:hypothetical protein [Streptomyces sp. YGL11-2]|uniref:hypothetical protein n=1 Tax=Streptomyces sp. YGL11-2 TaxID=3414028 RepID=UPI003CED8AF5